jgi:predicted dehydrogenase
MRVGVIGAGGMGAAHAGIYRSMKGVTVAGIAGRHEGRVRKVASRLGIQGFTDLDRLLADDSVDAIDVTVPSAHHREIVLAALERDKVVFCETPLALTLEDADAMIRVAKRRRRLFLVAQLMRFVPEYARVRQAAVSGEFGRPLVASAARLSPPYWSRSNPRPFDVYGEPLLELSIFDFNYLNWLLGHPRRVFTRGVVGARGAVDHYLVTVEYPRALGIVEGSTRLPRSHPFNTRLRVLFEKGMYESDFRMMKGHFSSSLHRYPATGDSEKVRVPGGDPYRAECAYFLECLRGKADPALLDASHDREALRVALAARTSFERTAPVALR